MTKNVSRTSAGNPGLLRSAAMKLGAMMLLVFLFVGTMSAQAPSDWVGNKALVDRQLAATRLKTQVNQIVEDQKNSGFRTHSGHNMVSVYYSRVVEEIVSNNRTTKDAVNAVSNALVAEGIDFAEVSRLVKQVLPVLQ